MAVPQNEFERNAAALDVAAMLHAGTPVGTAAADEAGRQRAMGAQRRSIDEQLAATPYQQSTTEIAIERTIGTSFRLLMLGLGLVAIALLVFWGTGAAIKSVWSDGRPGGAFGRFAAAMAFRGETLSPPSRYASGQAVSIDELTRAGLLSRKQGRMDSKLLGGPAYACVLDVQCAPANALVMQHAAQMLAERAKTGDEIAARDLCLLPLIASWYDYTIPNARLFCKAANRQLPNDETARRVRAAETSPWMFISGVYEKVL